MAPPLSPAFNANVQQRGAGASRLWWISRRTTFLVNGAHIGSLNKRSPLPHSGVAPNFPCLAECATFIQRQRCRRKCQETKH